MGLDTGNSMKNESTPVFIFHFEQHIRNTTQQNSTICMPTCMWGPNDEKTLLSAGILSLWFFASEVFNAAIKYN